VADRRGAGGGRSAGWAELRWQARALSGLAIAVSMKSAVQ